MAKRRSQAILVLLALVLIGAGLLAQPAPARAQGEPMSFRLAKLEARNCHGQCPRVIVADGIIEEDTPEAFVGFLQSVADAPNLRDVVVINSPGGRVVASMRLGAALRKLQAAVIVARFGDEGDDLNSPSGGQCMSACVYALMGGARRVVPPASRLGIHRMSSQESAGVGRFFAPATPSYASPDMVDALAGYAAQMGVSPTVIRVAERIPPEEIHIISPAELRRWRLASSKF